MNTQKLLDGIMAYLWVWLPCLGFACFLAVHLAENIKQDFGVVGNTKSVMFKGVALTPPMPRLDAENGAIAWVSADRTERGWGLGARGSALGETGVWSCQRLPDSELTECLCLGNNRNCPFFTVWMGGGLRSAIEKSSPSVNPQTGCFSAIDPADLEYPKK